jgi:membrane protein implicated in regulation of membrane protease activity
MHFVNKNIQLNKGNLMLGLKAKTALPTTSYEEGVVTKVVYQAKEWRVQFQGSYWPARPYQPCTLFPGDFVRVVRIDNITLLVEPA